MFVDKLPCSKNHQSANDSVHHFFHRQQCCCFWKRRCKTLPFSWKLCSIVLFIIVFSCCQGSKASCYVDRPSLQQTADGFRFPPLGNGPIFTEKSNQHGTKSDRCGWDNEWSTVCTRMRNTVELHKKAATKKPSWKRKTSNKEWRQAVPWIVSLFFLRTMFSYDCFNFHLVRMYIMKHYSLCDHWDKKMTTWIQCLFYTEILVQGDLA